MRSWVVPGRGGRRTWPVSLIQAESVANSSKNSPEKLVQRRPAGLPEKWVRAGAIKESAKDKPSPGRWQSLCAPGTPMDHALQAVADIAESAAALSNPMQPDEYLKLAAVEDQMWYFRSLHAHVARAL